MRASLSAQKLPKRSREAVREATRLAVQGYQGSSVTKNAEPKQQRKPIAAQKQPTRGPEEVRKATRLAMKGYQGKSTTKKA